MDSFGKKQAFVASLLFHLGMGSTGLCLLYKLFDGNFIPDGPLRAIQSISIITLFLGLLLIVNLSNHLLKRVHTKLDMLDDLDIGALPALYVYADSTADLHVRLASSAIFKAAQTQIIENGSTIRNHVRTREMIKVHNLDPAYTFMSSLVGALPPSSIYCATSMLASYDAITDKDFRGFKSQLKTRLGVSSENGRAGLGVTDEPLFGLRLYYVTGEISTEKQEEMRVASQCPNLVVKCLVLEASAFARRKDLTFILVPKRGANLRALAAEWKQKGSSEMNPFAWWIQSHKELFGVHFALEHDRDEVEHIEIASAEIERNQAYAKWKEQFINDWASAETVNPSDGAEKDAQQKSATPDY